MSSQSQPQRPPLAGPILLAVVLSLIGGAVVWFITKSLAYSLSSAVLGLAIGAGIFLLSGGLSSRKGVS